MSEKKDLTILVLLDPVTDDEPLVRVFDSEQEAKEFVDRVQEYLDKKAELEDKISDVEIWTKVCTLNQGDTATLFQWVDDHMYDTSGEEFNDTIEDEIY